MAAPTANPRRRQRAGTPRRRTAARRRRQARRRLIVGAAAVALLGLIIAAVMSPWLDRAVDRVALPLAHADLIREQAAEKDLDPALVAGVIYTESRFRDQTSPAGAKGLMQIMPSTADYIARKSGGSAFVQGDLATPEINIAYGCWYLRYLLDRYHENEVLALAAYNGGEGKVDEWVQNARDRGERFRAADHIPFPETREYVERVIDARRAYRGEYARELGL
jgi:soluble lytic murein transglycosylase